MPIKRLKDTLTQGYVPRSQGDKDFVAAHQTVVDDKFDDKVNKSNDENFKGKSVKYFDRASTRFGYNPGEDAAAYDKGSKKDPVYSSGKSDVPQVEESAQQGETVLTELSRKVLTKYINKAGKQYWQDRGKRKEGIKMAASKLKKEEVEPVNELSTATLKSYLVKNDRSMASNIARTTSGKIYSHKDNTRQYWNLVHGKMRADNQLAKREQAKESVNITTQNENVEIVSELSKSVLGTYIRKAASETLSKGFSSGQKYAGGSMVKADTELRKGAKRVAGIAKASRKMQKDK